MDAPAWLVIEDGTIVPARSFGSRREARGEIVFNTSMSGYVESLTDPSYRGQVLMQTYPLIGNYGVPPGAEWKESERIQVEGYVIRELTGGCEHRIGKALLPGFLGEFDVPGISGVDTRSLTKTIRNFGVMRAAITRENPAGALAEVKKMDFPDKRNLVAEVSTRDVKVHRGGKQRIALLDCGVKTSITRNLQKFATVHQFPYDTAPEDILKIKPDGFMISNGPGDPAQHEILKTCVKTVRNVAPELPTLGICLGHQIIALAFGARTFKLKFGHRGVNHPVMDLETGQVKITSQNHGFAVDVNLPSELAVLEKNLNDGTVEALRHRELDLISVQYHPEANPGPHDSLGIFHKFERLVKDAASH
jgi:carbamoyl-phosphate synthase small subunit